MNNPQNSYAMWTIWLEKICTKIMQQYIMYSGTLTIILNHMFFWLINVIFSFSLFMVTSTFWGKYLTLHLVNAPLCPPATVVANFFCHSAVWCWARRIQLVPGALFIYLKNKLWKWTKALKLEKKGETMGNEGPFKEPVLREFVAPPGSSKWVLHYRNGRNEDVMNKISNIY